VTVRRWVMVTSNGYVKDDDLTKRTKLLTEAHLYDLEVVPEPRSGYCFIPVRVTIEEESEGVSL
jgi:hypothetical protein